MTVDLEFIDIEDTRYGIHAHFGHYRVVRDRQARKYLVVNHEGMVVVERTHYPEVVVDMVTDLEERV